MANKRFLFTNSCHKSKAVVHPDDVVCDKKTNRFFVTKNTMEKIEKRLCGVPDCGCGIYKDSRFKIVPYKDDFGYTIGAEIIDTKEENEESYK